LERIDPTPFLGLQEGTLPALAELARAQLRADSVPAPALAIVGGALDGVERALAVDLRAGDSVAVEDPGFVRVFDLLRPLGYSLEPMRLDDDGILPEELERVLERGVRAVILTPRAQNPTGAALSAPRASELRTILAERDDVLVISDDHAAGVAGTAALCVSDEDRPRWAVIRSVSKSLGPDLRLAIMAGDPTTVSRVEGRQRLGTGWVSHVLQRIVAAYWSDPEVLDQLKHAERTYELRRRVLLEELAARGIRAAGRSGLNVWIPLVEEAPIVASLLHRGWSVIACERFRFQSEPAIRVTIARLEEDEAARFASDLAESLEPLAATYRA
jgi:DNA-binding transcriptional MocR family regulator